MTRHVLAMALAALPSGNCPGWTQPSSLPSPREKMRMIGPDSPVEVRFLDGSKLRGWLGEVSDSGFSLSHENMGHLEKSRVGFDIGVGIAVVAIGSVAGIGVMLAEK